MPNIKFLAGKPGGESTLLGPLAVEIVTGTMLAPKDDDLRSLLFLFYTKEIAERAAEHSKHDRRQRWRERMKNDSSYISNLPPSAGIDISELSLHAAFEAREIFAAAQVASSQPIEKTIETSWIDGVRAGSILLGLLRQWARGASVNVSVVIEEIERVGARNRSRGLGKKTLSNSWNACRSASHLWAALIDLKAEGEAFATGENYLICDLETLPRLLARSEHFRHAGISIRYTDHTGSPSILSDDDTWSVPAHIREILPEPF